MKNLLLVIIMMSTFGCAEVRTYIQVKDVATASNGKVQASRNQNNLFEYTYDINMVAGIVKRIKVRRLDQDQAFSDNKLYRITDKKMVLESSAGKGGEAIVAVANDGSEIIQLGASRAFTSRSSSFSQMITGVYKRTN